MLKVLFTIIFILFAIYCYSANLSQPPIDKNSSVQTQQYLKNISDNFNNLEVLTSTPNGTRRGKYGDIVLLLSGGSYYIEVCVSSPNGTIWKGIVLSTTP